MTSKRVDLISNHYRICSKDHDLAETLHQYEIKVELECSEENWITEKLDAQRNQRVEFRRKVVSAAVDQWMAVVGSNLENRIVKCDLDCHKLVANFDLLGNTELTEDTKLLQVPYCDTGLERILLPFSIQLKKTKFDRLTLMSIIIGVDGRPSPTFVDQTSAGTTTYDAENPIKLCGFKVLLPGQTVRAESLALGLAVSICNTSGWFYEPLDEATNLVDYLQDTFADGEFDLRLGPSVISYLNERLAGRQVELTHNKIFDLPLRERIWRIDNVFCRRPAIACFARFEPKYGIELKYPNSFRVELDAGEDHDLIPMELSQLIVDDKVHARKQAPGRQELKPLDYFEQVERHVKCLADSNDSVLKTIGVSIDTQPIRAAGHVLELVQLIRDNYRGDANGTEGGRYDTCASRFDHPIKLRKFSITFVSATKATTSELDTLKEFTVEYCRFGQSKGVGIDTTKAQVDEIIHENEESLKETLKKHVEQLNKQSISHSIMVLAEDCQQFSSCVHFLETQFQYLPNRSTRLSRLQLNHLKQILTESKSKNDAPMLDLWTKYNSQLGGSIYQFHSDPYVSQHVLNRLELPDDFLIVGVDVRQPKKAEEEEFSVTAVFGMWSIASRRLSYSTQLRAQPARRGDNSTNEQLVDDVGQMMERILDSYGKPCLHNFLPGKILILLNGTSSDKLMVAETSGLDKIVQVLDENYAEVGQKKPQVSCFEIKQQHNLRFKLSSPNKARGEDHHQIAPGTVIVDSNLLGHDVFAFQAAAISDSVGTIAPPIARKLRDGISSITDLDYQQLITVLCYLSPCSTKCTSIPAPLILAELASRRGKEIALVWKEQCFYGRNFIEEVNAFFTSLAGNPSYHETLFFV